MALDQEDRDMLIRIDENTTALKKVVFGNGRPGLASRVQALETAQKVRQQWPAIVAAVCAVVAVVWGFVGG